METIDLHWSGTGLEFEAIRGEHRTLMDGNARLAATPVGLLLEALAGCAAADVVDILQKGRQDLQGLTVRASAQRNEVPPKYFRRVEMEFVLSGTVEPSKAERAVQLSFDKYCSVYHSLRPDIELSWRIVYET
jgi:putative redox protein